jgi:poly(hydroxyalkanoate) granule-associated protein
MAKKKQTSQQRVYGDLRDSAHKIWLAGLGALAMAEEEGTKVFSNLVEAGEKVEARGKKRFELVKGRVDEAREKAGETFDKLGETFDDKVAGAVQRLGVPSRDEIRRLTKRVEELTAKVDKLKPRPKARKTTRKTAKS